MTEPRVVNTVEELKALDPETSPAVLFSASSFGADFPPEAQLTREVQQWDSEALEELLPATVLPAQPAISAEQVEVATASMNEYYSRGGVISSRDALLTGLRAAGLTVAGRFND